MYLIYFKKYYVNQKNINFFEEMYWFLNNYIYVKESFNYS